ncbi:MAG: DUF554 domain-containing protein [Chloroflexota bacterium]
MGGTLLNTFTVILGSLIGLLLGSRLSDRVQDSVVTGIGLITVFVGVDNAAATGNVLVPLVSVLLGVIIGEMLRIDRALEDFAGWLQRRFAAGAAPAVAPPSTDDDTPESVQDDPRRRFITGFVTASLVFCIGPLALLGSIQDGMGLAIGFEQLAIKSTLDGFASMAFAATFGIGVMFTAISVFAFQGSLALLGSVAGSFMTEPMIAEMTATGGIVLLGLSLVILDLKPIRIANFLPSLLVAPVIVAGADLLGIGLYISL